MREIIIIFVKLEAKLKAPLSLIHRLKYKAGVTTRINKNSHKALKKK